MAATRQLWATVWHQKGRSLTQQGPLVTSERKEGATEDAGDRAKEVAARRSVRKETQTCDFCDTGTGTGCTSRHRGPTRGGPRGAGSGDQEVRGEHCWRGWEGRGRPTWEEEGRG